jgi:hypothetical protein
LHPEGSAREVSVSTADVTERSDASIRMRALAGMKNRTVDSSTD